MERCREGRGVPPRRKDFRSRDHKLYGKLGAEVISAAGWKTYNIHREDTMSKGYASHRERQEQIGLLGKALAKRAGFACEWCGSKEELRPWPSIRP